MTAVVLRGQARAEVELKDLVAFPFLSEAFLVKAGDQFVLSYLLRILYVIFAARLNTASGASSPYKKIEKAIANVTGPFCGKPKPNAPISRTKTYPLPVTLSVFPAISVVSKETSSAAAAASPLSLRSPLPRPP